MSWSVAATSQQVRFVHNMLFFFDNAYMKMLIVPFSSHYSTLLTHHTERSTVLKGISLTVLLCPVTNISATVALIGLKFCMMVHVRPPGGVFSLLEAVPLGYPQNPKLRPL